MNIDGGAVLDLAGLIFDFAFGSLDTLAPFLAVMLSVETPLALLVIVGVLRRYRERQHEVPVGLARRWPSVSCVITCYSEGEEVRQTIATLAEQVYAGDIEIIAVVDGATRNDATWRAVENCGDLVAARPGRRLVKLPKWQRGGRVSSLNAGLHVATGEIVLAIDGDTSFDNDMVRAMARCFDDPDVPAAGGALRVRNEGVGIVTRLQSLEYMISMHGSKTGLASWNLLNNISGAFGAFRRPFIKRIGGWDTHTAEDLDLTVRIKQYFGRHPNLRIAFAPDAIGHTDVPATFRQLLDQRLRWEGDLWFIYLAKHGSGLSPRVMGWRSFLFTLVYGIGQTIVLPLLVVGFTCYITLNYPGLLVLAVLLLLYGLYFVVSTLYFAIYLIFVSERPKRDLRLVPWLLMYPGYCSVLKIWAVVAILNQVATRGHEQTSMAPWWVIGRGKRF